jgi:predicted RecA/RadA family phage recombinase
MSDSVYVQDGDIINHKPASDVKAGELVFIGGKCGQIVVDAVSGEVVGLRMKGVIRLSKANMADVYADGDPVLWDATNKVAAIGGADGTVGMAVNGGSAATDSYVFVLLNS